MIAYSWGTKSSPTWHHRSYGLAAMIFWRINILKSSSTERLNRSRGHLHVPQALGIPGCSRIINRSHGLAAILVWTKFFQKIFLLNRFINQCETSQLWLSRHVEYIVTNLRPPACERPHFTNSSRFAHRTDNSVATFRNKVGNQSRVCSQRTPRPSQYSTHARQGQSPNCRYT